MRAFNYKFIILAFLLSVQGFSQDNVFLNRDFWKTKPSVDVVTKMIKEGHNPSQANANNFDGVVYAILQQAPFETIVHLLSQKGNDVNKLTHDGRTYIFWAAYKGNIQLMEYLLKIGAKTDIKDDKGNTILNFAASSGQKNTKVYEICLANGANLKTDLNPDGANALLLAAPYDNDFKLVDYFVSKGLDLNSVDYQGNTAFNYVAKTGNITLMNKLLKRGVKGTNQAFLFAANGTRGHTNGIEVYAYLEEQGLNPNTTNKEGVTPLHIVASRNKNPEIISYFLDKGLNVNAADRNGNTPFLNATSRNNIEIIKILSSKVDDINYANRKGQTALMLATQKNTPEVMEFLIGKGADIKQIDAKGNNLVYYLIESFSPKNKTDFKNKLELLKSAGMDVKMPQSNGNTWYHMAVEKYSMELLKMASQFNQEINAKNNEGYTALQLAAMKAKDDIILKFLLEQGADSLITTDFGETAYDLASENELLKKNNISIEFLK